MRLSTCRLIGARDQLCHGHQSTFLTQNPENVSQSTVFSHRGNTQITLCARERPVASILGIEKINAVQLQNAGARSTSCRYGQRTADFLWDHG